MAKAPKTAGRPSDFSEALADQIVERLGDGESLRSICRGDDMPNKSTVFRWMAVNSEFATKCAHAREALADVRFEDAWDIADKATPETVQVARLKIDTIKWQTSKLAPKKYGERLELEHSGEINLDPEARRAKIAELLAKRNAAVT
jgi:hypothetical protein